MELTGHKVKLRILTFEDRAALLKAAADGALWQSPYTIVPNADSIDTYLSTALKGYSEGSVLPFVIELTGTQKVIGTTRFWKIDPQNRQCEIGYTWIAASWQRTFVNTEIKYLMLQYAFEIRQFIRVQFTTDVLNTQSQKAILRIGAKEEGIIRYERIMPNGRKRDSVRYSIIEDEWVDVKALLTFLKSPPQYNQA